MSRATVERHPRPELWEEGDPCPTCHTPRVPCLDGGAPALLCTTCLHVTKEDR